MEWRDQGLIIGARRHGETSLILEIMTREHGRHLGLVKGGRGRRTAPLLQPGNEVEVVWRARLEEHLGFFQVETTSMRAAELMRSAVALHALNHVGSLLRLLAERDPHERLLAKALAVLNETSDAAAAALRLVILEMAILTESGFGIDLGRCAATGTTQDLVFVSPKSGRAVSRSAGEPFRDRLLPLPTFLAKDQPDVPSADQVELVAILAGFELTGHFLRRDLYAPRGGDLPTERAAFIEGLKRGL